MRKINTFNIAVIALMAVATVVFWKVSDRQETELSDSLQECGENIEFSHAENLKPEPLDTTVLIETRLRRGEGPFNVMERLNIDNVFRQIIIDSLANETDFTTLRVGERFAAVFNLDTTQLLEFIYFENKITTHRVRFTHLDDGLFETTYILDEKPSGTRHRLVRGTLNAPTLDAQLRRMGLPSNIIGASTGILECKVSFRTDARLGDEFELLLQETVFEDKCEEGNPIERTLDERTQLLYVSYSGARAGTHRGFRYFDGDKSSYNAHYTEDGEALIFSGLRYPLDRIHITSSYGMRRHPVTGRNAMHWGVDYRAAVGTPVYAVAEGKVTKSTFDNLSGNYIAIRHKDGTSSYYLHLNRRSVAVGANVRARQLIGYSGNTGRSSGPHLHFGFKQANGQWMNPLQKRMIATPKLTGEKLENLQRQIAEIKVVYAQQLDEIENRMATTAEEQDQM